LPAAAMLPQTQSLWRSSMPEGVGSTTQRHWVLIIRRLRRPP
jgi:hypothetical protein